MHYTVLRWAIGIKHENNGRYVRSVKNLSGIANSKNGFNMGTVKKKNLEYDM
jgi:hypothetical protein